MEYYSSETCFMEEQLLLAKDMEYEDFNYLDTNIISSSSSKAHCSFEDYSDFPIDIQTFNFPVSQDSPNTNILNTNFYYDFQQALGYTINNYADEDYQSSVVVPMTGAPCKDEPVPEMPIFNVGFCPENESKNKMKKLNAGQPSKNLMAERRRRKRLNDRLSMLRSVVPKISKMDRTSILGDTIDYMKELLERINKLREEMDDGGSKQLGLMTIFNDGKPTNVTFARNSPKMEVERKNGETRIKICCGMKPGLLLSTVNTVEELGLEIEQCVISCFSDFTMQASCSQELKERDAEDIKQALFRKAAASTFLYN
ncbi:transcription factor bHLH93-like [Primulina tabacum]|uniref:transcription factor bHLH93-like n=1 Tax=Primulina tabacum TaxID=48773 RepID=UPI003F5A6151